MFFADLVLTNGKIYTVDQDAPYAEAVAVWNGQIIAVGSTNEILDFVGKNTELINLKGNLVLPGFIDNHTHFVKGGFMLSEIQLKDAKTPEEFGERLAAKSKELPPGAWITGGLWDHDNWPEGNLPTAELIDKYVPDRPVFVTRYDLHMAVANSKALVLAGITKDTESPIGGVIIRKKGSNEPEGVLKEKAMGLVSGIISDPSREELKSAILNGLAEAARVGVTSLQDMDYSADVLNIYLELLEEGRLTSRIDVRLPISRLKKLRDLGLSKNFRSNDFLKLGGLKAFVDGSVGSGTALFFDPYLSDPTTSGVNLSNPEKLKSLIIKADAAGFHLAVHAIGDKANSDLLDIVEETIKVNGERDRRFRIEHAQHIHPKDFKRYADLGVIASVQPYHAVDDGRWVEERIGEERTKTTYPFKSFLENDVIMTFGSDWTVAPLNPICGIDAAVTRRTTDGENPDGWYPEQKISVKEAVKAYTLASAFSAYDENIKGSIVTGKLADMIVLSQDIFEIPIDEIVNTEVLMTITAGKIVYEKSKGYMRKEI